jgi:hypothetical protein
MSETVQRLKWAMDTSFLSNLVICSNSPTQQYVVCAVEMELFQKPEHQEVVVLTFQEIKLKILMLGTYTAANIHNV